MGRGMWGRSVSAAAGVAPTRTTARTAARREQAGCARQSSR